MILKFSSKTCQPCRVLEQRLKSLGIMVQEVDIDLEPELVAKHRVRAVPTMVYLCNDLEYGRLIGLKSDKEILDWIQDCEAEVE